MIDLRLADYIALEIYAKYLNKDFDYVSKDLCLINEYLTDTLKLIFESGIDMPQWKTYSEEVSLKFSLNVMSIENLLNGTDLKSKKTKNKIIDISSIYILIRSLIENYAIFYYLFIEPKTNAEREFRFWIYKMSGLSQRQKLKVSTKEAKLKKEHERGEIEEVKLIIIASPFFNKIEKGVQKKIRNHTSWNTPAHVYKNFEELIKKSDLNGRLIFDQWKLYSNYVHSEFLSIIQIEHFYLNYNEQSQSRHEKIFLVTGILCRYIQNFNTVFKSAEIHFNTKSANLKEKIRFYANFINEAQNR